MGGGFNELSRNDGETTLNYNNTTDSKDMSSFLTITAGGELNDTGLRN